MLQAFSGDAEFIRLIGDQAFRGSVHSVFRNAINLRNDLDGKLYAIVARRFGNIPNVLLIDDDAFGLFNVESGDGARVDEHCCLHVGSAIVSVRHCREWCCRLPVLDPEHIPERAALLESILDRQGKPGGMKAGGEMSVFAVEMNRMLDEASAGLVAALVTENPGEATGQAVRLIGLGPGLTPSGDDFLVGLMAVLHCAPHAGLRGVGHTLGRAIAERASTDTNAISATALQNAAVGRFPEVVTALLEKHDGGDPRRLTAAATRLLGIGSSSGTDMLHGIVSGLKIVANVGGSPSSV